MRPIRFRAWDTVENKMIENLQDRCGLSADLKCCNHIIMQSTGLKDKNGVEIFEGDIVKSDNGCVGSVKYMGMAYAYRGKKADGRDWFDTITSNIKRDLWIEVIGNIHSNPELLEDQE